MSSPSSVTILRFVPASPLSAARTYLCHIASLPVSLPLALVVLLHLALVATLTSGVLTAGRWADAAHAHRANRPHDLPAIEPLSTPGACERFPCRPPTGPELPLDQSRR